MLAHISAKSVPFILPTLAGVCMGIYQRNPVFRHDASDWARTFALIVVAMMVVFICVPIFSMLSEKHWFGFHPRHFRFLWIAAFLLGVYGMPLIYRIATS